MPEIAAPVAQIADISPLPSIIGFKKNKEKNMDAVLHPSMGDILLRLLLAVIAGGVIGINRETQGHSAGFRTTIILCLASALAMIQANILMSLHGRALDSFVMLDTMRLPLGILTGVGFIGAGIIFKNANHISGVTTAATFWVVTVIGLCFGGGQFFLGITGTLICIVVLYFFKKIDFKLPRDQHALVVLVTTDKLCVPPDLSLLIQPLGYQVKFIQAFWENTHSMMHYKYKITWKTATEHCIMPNKLISCLNEHYQIVSFEQY